MSSPCTEAALADLLCEIFDSRELICFVRRTYGPDLSKDVPDHGTLSEVAFAFAGLLGRRGLIAEDLFVSLNAAAPRKYARIAAVALLYGFEPKFAQTQSPSIDRPSLGAPDQVLSGLNYINLLFTAKIIGPFLSFLLSFAVMLALAAATDRTLDIVLPHWLQFHIEMLAVAVGTCLLCLLAWRLFVVRMHSIPLRQGMEIVLIEIALNGSICLGLGGIWFPLVDTIDQKTVVSAFWFGIFNSFLMIPPSILLRPVFIRWVARGDTERYLALSRELWDLLRSTNHWRRGSPHSRNGADPNLPL